MRPGTKIEYVKLNGREELITARPVINIYRYASRDAEVGSQALYGWPLRRLSHENEWIRVRSEDGYEGWILEEGVRNDAGLREVLDPGADVAHIRSLYANVYREPDVTRHSPLVCLPWEARLVVHPEQDAADGQEDAAGVRWLRVRLLDGSVAYVLRGDVCASLPILNVAEMLALAQSFKGITYTWGGRSSFGFDCSGYTQMLMRQRGVLMPRDAQVQAAWEGLMPVDGEAAQPGDLFFFNDDGAPVTHTGLALGQGRFIHSSTQGQPGVQVSALDEPHWKTRLVTQRRVR